MMMVARYFRRTLFAAAKSEGSGAASMARTTAHNPLEEFFEADRSLMNKSQLYMVEVGRHLNCV
ncbi:hypothetical protein RchiOBHm_Chr3g0484351 [Rosa chinensis]|uniref:Uncharacterized protein n=1 Tax=Rosa chinensis TaxID=74649 RepID=A0A2P6REQ1_ROSCH|nr:hypothetical protein RchiOBHm_Chr3g0484351 [Rosa chinensis]